MRGKMPTTMLTATLFLLAACTTVDYESPRFQEKSHGHRTVAVLPFAMVFTGQAPRGFSAEQLTEIEELESLAFQAALYDSFLNRASVRTRGRYRVEIQPVTITNRILADRGIGLRRSWTMSPEELARLLGVDAVVRSTAHKARYLSDLASFGVEVGLDVLHEATAGAADPLLPPGLTKTYDVYVECVLVNGDDGDLLWKVAVHRATDWRRSANDVVVGVTRKLARKFPYRVG